MLRTQYVGDSTPLLMKQGYSKSRDTSLLTHVQQLSGLRRAMPRMIVHYIEKFTPCFVLPFSNVSSGKDGKRSICILGARSYPNTIREIEALSSSSRMLSQVFCFPIASLCLPRARRAQQPLVGRPRRQVIDKLANVLPRHTAKRSKNSVSSKDLRMIKRLTINVTTAAVHVLASNI